MPTIREILPLEQVRAGVVKQQPMMVSPEDLQQQQDEDIAKGQMMPGQASIQPSQALPMHEVNADPQKYPMEHASKLHSFLKNAAGGPATGFVTTNPDSHAMAKELAKSGHLQHHGSRPGQAGGGMVQHWSLTPKGLGAVGQGAKPKPGGGMGRPGMGGQRPGGGMKPPGQGMKPQGGAGGGVRPINAEKTANWLHGKKKQ
jgi:hypothetical protein